MTLLLAASVIPPLFLLWKVYQMDQIEKEPPKLLLTIFILGMISTIPAGLLEMVGQAILVSILPEDFLATSYGTTVANLLMYLIVVGGAEELVKYLAMRIPTWRNREFNYVFDGVIYGVTSAAGFAALENILYVADTGLLTAGIRAWTAIPLHVTAGLFMGHYYGIAKAADRYGNIEVRNKMLRRSILIPMLIHGIYDFIATQNNEMFILLFYIYIIIVDIFAYRSLIKYARQDIAIN